MNNNEANTQELDQGEPCGNCKGFGWVGTSEFGMMSADDCTVCDGTGLLTPGEEA